jgi:hypothetical protein
MKMHFSKHVVAIMASLTVATSGTVAHGGTSTDTNRKSPLVGVWQVLRHGVDCDSGQQLGPDFPVIMTFHGDGTMTAVGNAPGGGPFDTNEYGTWQRQAGEQIYSFRDLSYGYDETGTFASSGTISATVTLAADRNTFSYSATIQIFDANGNLLFTFCGAATGTRFQ